MKIDNSLGTYEQVFQNSSKEVRDIADTIHSFILKFDKDVCIVPRVGEKSVSYGIGTKKMSESYCYIMPNKGYLNLGFPHGTELTDLNSMLEGVGKKYRHIKIHSIENARQDSVEQLIENARNNRIQATRSH
jgi:hypothetical protein